MNTNMRSFILAFFILTASPCLLAQNVRTSGLSWTVDRLTDLNANYTKEDYACVFRTNSESISWIQKSGASVTTVTVTETEGNWTDVSSNGKISYQVSIDNIQGSLVFERTENGVFITLDLETSDPGGLHHKYRVSSVSTL